jgi:hypothetical protein
MAQKIGIDKTSPKSAPSPKGSKGAPALASSWVRSLTLYIAAVSALCLAVLKLQQPIKKLFPSCPTWLWLAIASLPLVGAFVAYSLPALTRNLRDRRLRDWGIKITSATPQYFRVAPSRILKVRFGISGHPAGFIGLEKRLGVVPQGDTYLQHRPKFRAPRVRNPTALISCLSDLVNVPADGGKQRNAALQRQEFVLGEGR